jgi:spore maturation protein CgeB
MGKFLYSHSTENYVVHALQENGCEVMQVEVSTMRGIETTKEYIRRFQPDFILFSKPEPRDAEAILNNCRSLGIPTVCWQWDLFFGLRKKFPKQFRADLLLTTDGGHDEEYLNKGFNHQVLRQGIHKPEAVMVRKPSTQWDVAFVGGCNVKGKIGGYHPSRDRLVHFLQEEYKGRFLHITNTRGMNLNRLLAQVKVVVGDSYPTPHGHYWSNRIYEVTGRGGFLLHPEVAGLDDEFTDGVHYVSYPRDDFAVLRSQVETYLTRTSDREEIRLRGHQRTSERYSYELRVGQLLQKVQSLIG